MRDLNDLYDSLPTFLGAHIVVFKLFGLRWQTEKVSVQNVLQSKLFYLFKKKNWRILQLKMLVQHVRYDWCSLMKDSDIWILMEYSEKSRIFTLAYLSIPNDKCTQRWF